MFNGIKVVGYKEITAEEKKKSKVMMDALINEVTRYDDLSDYEKEEKRKLFEYNKILKKCIFEKQKEIFDKGKIVPLNINLKLGNVLKYLKGHDLLINGLNYEKTNELTITKDFNLNIDILHICIQNNDFSNESITNLLNSYEKIFKYAKNNNYKKIISVSLGTEINGYRHNKIGFLVSYKINELIEKYDIDFTLVLDNKGNFKEYFFKEYYSIGR